MYLLIYIIYLFITNTMTWPEWMDFCGKGAGMMKQEQNWKPSEHCYAAQKESWELKCVMNVRVQCSSSIIWVTDNNAVSKNKKK